MFVLLEGENLLSEWVFGLIRTRAMLVFDFWIEWKTYMFGDNSNIYKHLFVW